MKPVIHPEYLEYDNNQSCLQSHNKTLSRITHKGETICQRVDGYYIGQDFHQTLQDAINSIDRYHAFDAFFDAYGEVCTRLKNVMCYRGEYADMLYACSIVNKHKLPLIINEVKNGFVVEFRRAGI